MQTQKLDTQPLSLGWSSEDIHCTDRPIPSNIALSLIRLFLINAFPERTFPGGTSKFWTAPEVNEGQALLVIGSRSAQITILNWLRDRFNPLLGRKR